jgi:hypothetical protein
MIETSRDTIADALVAAGLQVIRHASERFAAPAVMLEGGSPWAESGNRAGALRVSWRLTIIAGRASAEGAHGMLDATADAVVGAMLSTRGVAVGALGRPARRLFSSPADAEYLVASLDITHFAQ